MRMTRKAPSEPVRQLRLVSVSASSHEDAELVEAARNGDEGACEALFRRHHRKVAGLAFRLLGRDDDVDDIVQDAFIEAFASLTRLNDPQAFSSWLCAIVVTRVGKRLRRRRLLERLLLAPKRPLEIHSALSPSCPPDVALELSAVYRVIDDLPPSVRMVLLLRRVQGLTNEEVAQCMKLSVATVKRRLAEAEERLDRFREVMR